jgi:hypothetical protein
MDLKSALHAVQTTLAVVPGLAEPIPSIEVCSGAIRHSPDDVYPVLCSSEELAIDLWLNEIFSYTDGRKFQFVKFPTMTTLLMTIMDRKQQQRVVSDRYVVTSHIRFV